MTILDLTDLGRLLLFGENSEPHVRNLITLLENHTESRGSETNGESDPAISAFQLSQAF